MVHATEEGCVWNALSDDGFSLEVSNNVWKDISRERKMKGEAQIFENDAGIPLAASGG